MATIMDVSSIAETMLLYLTGNSPGNGSCAWSATSLLQDKLTPVAAAEHSVSCTQLLLAQLRGIILRGTAKGSHLHAGKERG
jgi:hypothetical protein